MKNFISVIFLLLLASQVSSAGNGGGVGMGKMSYVEPAILELDNQISAIRVIDASDLGLNVEVETQTNSTNTFLSYDSLETSNPNLVNALELSFLNSGAWIEL
ncbi:MAG: hypothetical protein H6625_07355 [Bdellovibrionaceae bacterium]|nr:hypothetical protein [Pseudobdellovibrionaceae bacterium]